MDSAINIQQQLIIMDSAINIQQQLITVEQCSELFKELLAPMASKFLGGFQRTHDDVELHPENHSPIIPKTNLNETWLWFLQERALVNCNNALLIGEAPFAQDQISNLFLPALLYLKLVSIFDEALEEYITVNRVALPGHHRGVLHHRLEFLDKHGVLNYTQPLQKIRNTRNSIGHKPTSPLNWQSQQVSWQELDDAISEIHAALQQIGMVGIRPDYEGFASRHSEEVPPEKPDVCITLTFRYGIKENGQVIIQFTHTFDFYHFFKAKQNDSSIK